MDRHDSGWTHGVNARGYSLTLPVTQDPMDRLRVRLALLLAAVVGPSHAQDCQQQRHEPVPSQLRLGVLFPMVRKQATFC